ncbi:hypothetical protein F511_37371 [Dorcoceras hygrometricum]|uniref:Dystroglycan-like n=1 Tax=Dorcoceras hygrometricum TaxID=472368 RepID=A0A2Z7C773_9LAMI|nr:hypothetical protein F511_37371 [Dorcoceras hygrometricum]
MQIEQDKNAMLYMRTGSSKDPKDCTKLNTRTGSDHRMCERMGAIQTLDHTWSTTGDGIPSSACTRRTDEICADGFSSSRLAGNDFSAARGGGGGGFMRRGGAALNALGITDSACKNQLVVVSVQYGPFNPYIPIRSTTIGKSRVAIDPIAMHTSWRSNSDIASVTSIGYPRMSASGESSTTMHRLLHASGSHPILTPYDPKGNSRLPVEGFNLRWRIAVVWYTSRKVPVARQSLISYSSEMASSLISNSHHIDFESVFGLDNAGMVQMFETLITTGLKEFLGCPTVFYKAALTEFFANISVREDGMVVSTIGGTAIEISQEMFAEAFELPTEGLIDLTDVPKNFVFDARSLFSDSKEQVSMSCLKKAMKFQYRLLHDILAKTIYVKAGSFDSVTCDRFLLMTAITFDVKINWSSLLFGVFKEMVTHGSRQAKGYAIQICVLLSNVPGLELGESNAFPVPRVLNEKTVRRYVSINEKIGVEEVTDAPRAKKTPVKKTVPKKRQATGDAGDPPAADPDDIIEQILIQLDTASATKDDYTETWFDRAFDEEFASTEQKKQDSEEQIDFVVAKTGEEASSSKNQPEELMSLDDLLMQITEDMMLPPVSASEITKIRLGESINIPGVQEHDLYYASLPRISVHDKGTEPLVEDEPIKGNPARETVELICGDVEFLVGLRDQRENGLPIEQPCSSTYLDTSIGSGAVHAQFFSQAKSKCWVRPMVKIDGLWTPIQGPEFLRSSCKLSLFVNKIQVPECVVEEDFVPHGCVIEPFQYWGTAPSLVKTWESARQEGQTQDDIQLLRLNELKKSVMAHDIKADTDSLDVRNKFNAIDAKFLLLDGQIAAIRNDQLEFQSKIAADILSLSTQIGDIADYIRGSDAKKGEIGSSSHRPPPVRVERRPLPT